MKKTKDIIYITIIVILIILLISTHMYYKKERDNRVAMIPSCYVQNYIYFTNDPRKSEEQLPSNYEYYGKIIIYDDYTYDDIYEDLSTNNPDYMNLEVYVDQTDSSTIYLKTTENKYIKLEHD